MVQDPNRAHLLDMLETTLFTLPGGKHSVQSMSWPAPAKEEGYPLFPESCHTNWQSVIEFSLYFWICLLGLRIDRQNASWYQIE